MGQVQYAVSSDGQRFLINTLIEDVDTSPITGNSELEAEVRLVMPGGAS